MRNLVRLAAVILLFSFTLSGCYYDKESELYPSTTCGDTTNVTYSQSISPIMTANCNVCHSTALATNGVVTDNYKSLKYYGNNGMLWVDVNWEGAAQTHMPSGSLTKLSTCDLVKIKKWVDAQCPDN